MPFLRGEFAKSHERVYRTDPLFKPTSSMVFSCFCGYFGVRPAFSPIGYRKNLIAYLDDL